MKVYPLQRAGMAATPAYRRPLRDAIVEFVSDAHDSDGRLEKLQEQVDNLAGIVADLMALVVALAPESNKALVVTSIEAMLAYNYEFITDGEG